jgi:hypothetical protein
VRERLHGEPKQEQRTIVARAPVQVELVATTAAVHQDPLAVATDGDGDRFHERAAVGVSVPRMVVIEVTTPQAVGAMVAVSRADSVGRNVHAAMATSERSLTAARLTAALVA